MPWMGFAGLEKVIPEPKERPEGWLSAAYPLDSEDPESYMCSAGYQVGHAIISLLS